MLESVEDKIIYAAARQARNLAGKEILFDANGISVKDHYNSVHTLESEDGIDYDFEKLKTILTGYTYSSGTYNVRSIGGIGEFEMVDAGGWFQLKPKKVFAPCIEAVIPQGHQNFDFIRNYYTAGGVDVFILCEGDTRARDLARAIVAERSQMGLPTEFHSKPARYSWREEIADKDIPQVFKTSTRNLPVWDVVELDSRGMVPKVVGAIEGEKHPKSSSIHIGTYRNNWEMRRILGGVSEQKKSNLICMTIELVKSKPVVNMSVSKGLTLPPVERLENTPWQAFRDRRDKLTKNRAPKVITWFPTTEAVAEAFIERKSPRGFVSGKSLFFHGPVAYSIWKDNPVAAQVDFKDGTTGIFYGRASGIGGTKAGTVSQAQADIARAANKMGGIREFSVGELTDFLMLKDLSLGQAAARFKMHKDEVNYPNTCKIDLPKLRKWLLGQKDEADAEIEASHKTTFPTNRKSAAWYGLARLVEMKDELEALIGKPLPDLGSSSEYRNNGIEEAERVKEWRERKAIEAKERNEAPQM